MWGSVPPRNPCHCRHKRDTIGCKGSFPFKRTLNPSSGYGGSLHLAMTALPGTGIGLFEGLLHFLTIGKEVRWPLSWALGDLECGGLSTRGVLGIFPAHGLKKCLMSLCLDKRGLVGHCWSQVLDRCAQHWCEGHIWAPHNSHICQSGAQAGLAG